MALFTVGGILTAIDDYLSRNDLNVAFKSEYFLTLANTRIQFGSTDPRFPSEPLRCRGMEAMVDIPTSSQFVPVPDGYLSMRRIYLDTSPVTALQFLPPMDFWMKYVGSVNGKPLAYTIESSNIVFGPVPDAPYTAKVLYYQGLTGLDSSSGTNWLMENVPSVYLYGCLLEAACVIQDDEQIARYGPMFAGAIAGVMKSDRLSQYSGAPLQMRSDSATP